MKMSCMANIREDADERDDDLDLGKQHSISFTNHESFSLQVEQSCFLLGHGTER